MNKKNLIIVISSTFSLLIICTLIFIAIAQAHGDDTLPTSTSSESDQSPGYDLDDENDDDTYIPSTDIDATPTPHATEIPEEPFVPATEMDLDPSSITVFVNKEFSLPKNYKPDELVTPNVFFDLIYYDERTLMRPEAATALEQLFQAASEQGYELAGISGYRSYQRQKKIFTDNILTKGKSHTLKYSAVPGTSEHQTGLTMDISCLAINYDLSTTFGTIPEGIWVAENAHLFGFTIRYPKDKVDITGYAYEPWHLRYVGKGLAKYLYDNDLTLEEYYNYTPGKNFNFEAMYADLINITPKPSQFPMDGEGIVLGENGEIIEGELGEETAPADTEEPTDDDKDDKGDKDDQGSKDDIKVTPTIPISPTPTLTPSPTPTITITLPPKDPEETPEDTEEVPESTDPVESGNNGGPDGPDVSTTPTPTVPPANQTNIQ